MPFVGQDKFSNAAREAIQRASEQMRRVRGKEWGRIPEGSSAIEKARTTNQRNMQRWTETQQQINKQ